MGVEQQTLLLGIVQGVTEFLPISSSGHLALLQIFFDFRDANLLAFDLLLHCATLGAVLIFFRKDIGTFLTEWLKGFASSSARRSEGWVFGWAVVLGTLVTGAVALPLKGSVEAAMQSRLAVGLGLFVTAGVLSLVPLLPERQRTLSIKIALVVGLAQGLAVFPGISRSGSTIVAGLAMGLAAPEAFRLSFLMSVPAIAGASLLEALHLLKSPAAVLPEGWLLGAAAAFAIGWFSLAVLRRLVLSGRWAYFGLYCFVMGLVAVISDISGKF